MSRSWFMPVTGISVYWIWELSSDRHYSECWFYLSPTEPLQGEPAAGRSGVLCKLGVLRGDLYPSPVPHREAFLPPAVWLAVLSHPWHRDKDRGEYSTMAMSKDRDGEWSKAEFGSGIKGNLDNISFPRSNFCMDKVLYTFVINFCKSLNVFLIKSTIENFIQKNRVKMYKSCICKHVLGIKSNTL